MISILLGLYLWLPTQEIEQILEKHFQAIGQDYLSAFRTGVIEGKIIQNSQLEYSFVTYLKRRHKVRTELTIGRETIIDVFDGQNGWHKNINNHYALSRDEKNKLKIDGLIDSRLSYLQSSGVELNYRGKKTITNKHYHHIQTDYEGTRMNFFIDETTFLLFRIIEEKLGANKEITETTYFNYRDFGGLKVPMIIREIGPSGRLQTMIDDVAYDVAVADSLFLEP